MLNIAHNNSCIFLVIVEPVSYEMDRSLLVNLASKGVADSYGNVPGSIGEAYHAIDGNKNAMWSHTKYVDPFVTTF